MSAKVPFQMKLTYSQHGLVQLLLSGYTGRRTVLKDADDLLRVVDTSLVEHAHYALSGLDIHSLNHMRRQT
jgi:hypothetical protein